MKSKYAIAKIKAKIKKKENGYRMREGENYHCIVKYMQFAHFT